MTGEVHTPCPACGEEIPFYYTVDEQKECPECGTHKDELFEIAESPSPDGAGETQPALTDGGSRR